MEDENGDWVMKGLEPPTILPLPDLRESNYYVGLELDWDLPRSEDITPEFKWTEGGLSLNFELPHFSTYLVVMRPAYFDDVAPGAYYYEAVKWAVDNGITSDTDATHFSPAGTCTRAQLAAFLWRRAGKPVVNGVLPFTDADEGAWYAEAVRWTVSEGIVTGYVDGTFRPNGTLTRAQAMTMLYRFARHNGIDVSVGEDTNILSYEDAFEIGEWAVPALQWACGAGVMQGSGGRLLPNGTCTRGQLVTFLYRATQGK